MFVAVLTGGLIAGVLFGAFLVYRWRVKLAIATLGILVLAVLVTSVPVQLSTRVGLVIGLLLGFLLTVGSNPSTKSGDEPAIADSSGQGGDVPRPTRYG